MLQAVMVPVIRLLLLLAGSAAIVVGCAIAASTIFLVLYNWHDLGDSGGIIAGIVVPLCGLLAVIEYIVYRSAKGLRPARPGEARTPRGFEVVPNRVEQAEVDA